MDQFNVVWFNGSGLPEAAELIYHGLLEAGYDAAFTRGLGGLRAYPERRRIIFSAYLGKTLRERGVDWREVVREQDVLYQAEQLRPEIIDRHEMGDLLLSRTVWDYSVHNVRFLVEYGCPRAALVPLGFAEHMRRIVAQEPDIDVLFYGLVNPRRQAILDALRTTDLRVEIYDSTNPVWGEERDALIARSKIVLNIHYYEARIFEAFRVVYPLVNSRCVVSEDGLDPVEGLYRDAAVFCPYDALVETCLRYAHDNALRHDQQFRAARAMAALRQADILGQVLAQEPVIIH